MRIKRLVVQGYKNLGQRLELDELGPVHVIHGGNNVGKSNLLEAVALLFGVGQRAPVVWTHEGESVSSTHTTQSPAFAPWSELFSFYSFSTILVHTVLELDVGERMGPRAEFRLAVGWGAEVSAHLSLLDPSASDPKKLLTRAGRPRFQLIQTDRTLLGDGPAQRSGADRGLIPQPLALALYDAQQSLDPVDVGRWRLFQELLETLQDITGPGRFVVLYDRARQRAQVAFEQGNHRIPAHLMGSGVQHLVALVGQVLMTGADIVAIEEPELNLRHGLQRRLAELFRRMTQDPRGPQQLLLTSHSPAFEGDAPFHLLEPGEGGPTVRRLPASDAARATEQDLPPAPQGSVPRGWVSSEGLLQLPGELLDHLGLPQGGGVMLGAEEDPRAVRITSDEEWLRLHGKYL